MMTDYSTYPIGTQRQGPEPRPTTALSSDLLLAVTLSWPTKILDFCHLSHILDILTPTWIHEASFWFLATS